MATGPGDEREAAGRRRLQASHADRGAVRGHRGLPPGVADRKAGTHSTVSVQLATVIGG
jgi:hypothetical protein